MVRSKVNIHKNIGFWFIVLFSFTWPGFSQGLLLDEDTHTPVAYPERRGNKSLEQNLKGVYKINLRPYAPPPQLQGEILSCTGWAVGYGALSIMNSIKNNWKDSTEKIKDNAFSALFIYNQIWKGNCVYSGSNIMDAGKLLMSKGDLASKDFDKFKNKCDRLPKEEELKRAEKFKIQEFEKLFSRDEPSIDKIYKTKFSLSRKLPVVIGISIKKNFKLLKANDAYWNPMVGDTTFADQHAMTVVGFDDGKGAFELMNSWGPGWANGGFVWIKYADFAEYTKQAYHFIPFNYLLGENEIELNVRLEKPMLSEDGSLGFKEINMASLTNLFQPVDKFMVGDQVRLSVMASKSKLYLYCFSIDSKNNYNIHWPANPNDEETLEELNKYNLSSSKNQLFIPDEFKALVFSYRGLEYIFLLLSTQKIPKFKESISAFKNSQLNNKYEALIKVFGKKVVPENNLKPSPNKITVRSDYSNKMILPVIINLNIQ